MKTCSIEGCSRPHKSRAWCDIHYRRWLKSGDPLATKIIRGDDVARFWSKVKKMDSCWEWQGHLSRGYGHHYVQGGKLILAHRYSFWLHNGFWPEPYCLHSCDNSACVNPDHLSPGTAKQNAQDCVARGRKRLGEANPKAKLTESQVRELRSIAPGHTFAALGRRYNISPNSAKLVVRRQSWRHVV